MTVTVPVSGFSYISAFPVEGDWRKNNEETVVAITFSTYSEEVRYHTATGSSYGLDEGEPSAIWFDNGRVQDHDGNWFGDPDEWLDFIRKMT
jgi:hypothetical protein